MPSLFLSSLATLSLSLSLPRSYSYSLSSTSYFVCGCSFGTMVVSCSLLGRLVARWLCNVATSDLGIAIQTPDIFLLSGKPADIEPVMKMYESGVEVDLDLSPDPFMVCGVLLESLRRLPGAIVPPAVMLEIQGLRDQGKFTAANVGGILSELPVPNILLLKHMIAFLCRVTYHADHNRMTAARLSTIFAPLIVHESGAPLNHQIEIVAALVTDPSLLQFAQKGNHQPKKRIGTFMDGIAVSYATAIRDVASMVCAETIHLLIDPVTCHTPRHVSLVGKLFLTNFKLLFTTVSSGGASGVPADRVTPSSSPDLAEASGNTSGSDSPSMPRKMGTGGRAQLTFSIELAKMHLVEKKSKDGGVQQLRITCKNGSHLSLSITNQTDFQQAWEHLKSFAAPQHLSRLFAFTYGLHDMSRIKDASRGAAHHVSWRRSIRLSSYRPRFVFDLSFQPPGSLSQQRALEETDRSRQARAQV